MGETTAMGGKSYFSDGTTDATVQTAALQFNSFMILKTHFYKTVSGSCTNSSTAISYYVYKC